MRVRLAAADAYIGLVFLAGLGGCVAAFLVSETADWLVYTLTNRPLRDRILASSAISSPLDSLVFLGLIGFLSPASFILQSLSKFAGAVVTWAVLRHRASRTYSA